jgi:hypothetical protein
VNGYFLDSPRINEMKVQEAKSPVKNLITQRCAEGFNSGIRGVITDHRLKQLTHRHVIGQGLKQDRRGKYSRVDSSLLMRLCFKNK